MFNNPATSAFFDPLNRETWEIVLELQREFQAFFLRLLHGNGKNQSFTESKLRVDRAHQRIPRLPEGTSGVSRVACSSASVQFRLLNAHKICAALQ